LELANFLREKDSDVDPVDGVETAVRYWLDQADWKPELLQQHEQYSRGYNWKSLFLPHGTEARIRRQGEYVYARVEGDNFIYLDTPMSPAAFANQVVCNGANAWRYIWIRRPEDSHWVKADDCRKQLQIQGDQLLREFEASAMQK
jgi:hypothetical protein